MKAISEESILRAIGALQNRVTSCERMIKTRKRAGGERLNDQHVSILKEGMAKDTLALNELNGAIGSNVVKLEIPK